MTVLHGATNSPTDEGGLLERWTQGCQSSGAALVGRYEPSLRRFFASKAPEAAEDLSQTTLLALLESRSELRDRASIRGYVFGIARNQLYQHLRSARTRRERARFNTTSLLDRAPSPSSLATRQESDSTLLHALATLPMEMRILLELTYWEELTASDAADMLGVAENTVHSRLHRARRRLRLALRKLEAAPRLTRTA